MGADRGGIHAGRVPGERAFRESSSAIRPFSTACRPWARCCSPSSLGTFLAVQLFRWEKEEKIQPRKKLWVLAVLGPFLAMGCYRAYSKEHIGQNEALFRDLQRSGVFLIRNTRIFTGDGSVIENGSVLVRDGKIAEIFPGAGPDPEQLRAEVVEGAGKTLLPGLVDVHVHLSSPGGISTSTADYDVKKSMPHAAAALLYSGVTAARSAGDGLDESRSLRDQISSGSKLGAQLFICGPMFTAEGGHGTEFIQNLPPAIRDTGEGADSSVRPRLPRRPAARCAS